MTTHALYTGVTQSGKTTLARAMSRQICLAKGRVIVYDPLGTDTAGGGWGESAQVVEDDDDFLDVVYSQDVHNAHIFVDEAHNIFSHSDKTHLWLLTQGRHYGLRMHLITQRPTKVHPDARTNCGRGYVFRLAYDDMRAIGLDYGFSDIHRISLDKGDFLVLNSGSSRFERANVFSLV